MREFKPYPLVLTPILRPKVWGGDALRRFGKPVGDQRIGESWELADLDRTSASGGGGEAAHTIIKNGAMTGETVRGAMDAWGERMLGKAERIGGGFPLLVKYLDAREHLSIQIHPSTAYAHKHPDAHLKTESWYVLEAQPGAVIYAGLKDGVDEAAMRSAIENGTVPEIMRTHPAVPGECWTLESGTVHALGAGVVVAEVQTPSDTTFRVYDWAREYGRGGRELHIEQAIECASFAPPPEPMRADLGLSAHGDPMGGPPKMGSRTTRIAETAFYRMDAVSASCASVDLGGDGGSPMVVMFPRTMGASIASESDAFSEVVVEAGQTVLIPAACAESAVLRAGPGTEAVVGRVR
ncbi:MAG: class I mannose-6-phosphate isomerase [Phycisphaerales bacterium]|nr:class I mannose-6-phosphate isomerase [Phycisphaerales bacterium]